MSFFVPSFSLLFVLLVLLSRCCTIKGELEGGSGGGERLKRIVVVAGIIYIAKEKVEEEIPGHFQLDTYLEPWMSGGREDVLDTQ